MVAWARGVLAKLVSKLSTMARGTGRGSEVFECALKIAPVIAASLLDVAEIEDAITGATNFDDVTRDLQRGLEAPAAPEKSIALLELESFRRAQVRTAARERPLNLCPAAGRGFMFNN